jgi:phosphatidylethanolamine-binding protein (PEBP) family uncharacterized protein
MNLSGSTRTIIPFVKRGIPLLIVAGLLTFANCKKKTGDMPTAAATTTDTTTTKLKLSSTAFTNEGTYPKKYTCDSLGISPPLSWAGAPKGTTAYAITMHHIPGPGDKHVYMVIYNIPASVNSVNENSSGVGLWGINTINGGNSYTPPCSQGPGAKLYTMTVYALSANPAFSVPQSQIAMDTLLSAIKGITLDTATLNVTYTRF